AWGQPSMNPASRFLDELPGDLVDWRRLEPSSPGFGFGSGSRGTPRAATTWGGRRSSSPSSSGTPSFGKGWKDTVALKLDGGDPGDRRRNRRTPPVELTPSSNTSSTEGETGVDPVLFGLLGEGVQKYLRGVLGSTVPDRGPGPSGASGISSRAGAEACRLAA